MGCIREDQRGRAGFLSGGNAVYSMGIASGHRIPDLEKVMPVGSADTIITDRAYSYRYNVEYSAVRTEAGAAKRRRIDHAWLHTQSLP